VRLVGQGPTLGAELTGSQSSGVLTSCGKPMGWRCFPQVRQWRREIGSKLFP